LHKLNAAGGLFSKRQQRILSLQDVDKYNATLLETTKDSISLRPVTLIDYRNVIPLLHDRANIEQ